MARINIYDNIDKKWKSVASNDAANIVTNNVNFVDSGKDTATLDTALTKIAENINKIKGNISWLATYGGGGSGTGTTTTDAAVKVSNSDITEVNGQNVLYVSTKSYMLNYTISSTKSNVKYYVTINLDGTNILTNKEIYTNNQQTFTISDINMFTEKSPHTLLITAYDADEIQAKPYSLSITESSIKVSASNINMSASIGKTVYLEYTISSKILNSDITLSVKNEDLGLTYTTVIAGTVDYSVKLVNVDFFKNMFGNNKPIAGSTYRITAFASVPLGKEQIISEKVEIKVVIEDSATLVVLADGITTVDEVNGGTPSTKFAKGGNISFNFTPYLSEVSIIYYAAQITHNGNVTTIGDYNDYLNNNYTNKGASTRFSLSIPDDDNSIGIWYIDLKCWSEKGSPNTIVHYECNVVTSTSSLLADQNPNSKRFASWNTKSVNFPSNTMATQWTSTEVYVGLDNTTSSVENILNTYNTNGSKSGFLHDNNQPILRLYNEAYGIVNIKPFVADKLNSNNWGHNNFTLSFTYKSDIHPYKDRTVMFCGIYSKISGQESQMIQGIKIGLENISWVYNNDSITKTMSCKIQQNVINTIDFVKSDDTIKIYANGVLQIAREIDNTFYMNFDSPIYLACDYGSSIANFCDIDFYDIRLFRTDLNPKEIVINAMNAYARAHVNADGTIDYNSYTIRKTSNFFSTTGGTNSLLFDNDFRNVSFADFISGVGSKSPLPVLSIKCNGSHFTRDVYEKLGTNKTIYGPCTGEYYDPDSTNSSAVSLKNLGVAIQGTSSVNYRSKNIELYFQGNAINKDGTENTTQTELFQPKPTWMPENEFTLKADVVDSAHANNASIGKWINDNASIIFEDTPPMTQLKSHPIVDSFDGKQITDVTIKHTLEGFPIILLIQFDGEQTETMAGIYSFNLGRGAYYNMGFKFLKTFSRKTYMGDGNYVDNACPSLVKTYEAYDKSDTTFGINQSQVYSYEFSLNENVQNENAIPTGLFWQDDLSIIQYQGEFKYNGATGDNSEVPSDSFAWKELQYLFSDLAGMTSSEIKKYVYDSNLHNYILGSGTYPANSQWGTLGADLVERLCIKNAYAYYMVSIIFGLVDSLGKNMTLRSYNVTNQSGNITKWYPCFYDMDTANALSNVGDDNVPKTAYIDSFSNSTTTDGVNSLVITYNDDKNGYDEYSSRLWNVLRDSKFLNAIAGIDSYEALWKTYRNNPTLIKDANYYIDNHFAKQTQNCGELLYNYDYQVKYLTKYALTENTPATYANIEFLHGNRVNFVRDWLTKRFIFLDGVFGYSGALKTPYNTTGTFALGGSDLTKIIVRTTAPVIFTANIAQKGDYRYFIPEDEDTVIQMGQLSSFNTQVAINNTPIISKLNGLSDVRFQSMKDIHLSSLSEFDISKDVYLSSEPVNFKTCFINDSDGKIYLKHLNLANTDFLNADEKNTFSVELQDYDKLKTIDISYSCVYSIALPKANLSDLKIDHSSINNIQLEDQQFISNLDITGCQKLTRIDIINCNKLTQLNFSNLVDLNTVYITNCASLTSITCNNNVSLNNITIVGCTKLSNVNLSNNPSTTLKIDISGTRLLSSVNLSQTQSLVSPILPQVNDVLTNLNLSNTAFDSIQFGSKEITKYNGENVLDLSMYFTNDSAGNNGYNVNCKKLVLNVKNMKNVKYIKFENDNTNPINIGSSYFLGCLSLKRVFGYINLIGNSVFNGCVNYMIRDESSYTKYGSTTNFTIPDNFTVNTSTESGKINWNTDFNYSNILISYADINSDFGSTNITLYDMYYIVMNKCQNVTSMSSSFIYCKNIETTIENSINRYLFANCPNLVNVNSMFWGSFKMGSKTLLYSPEHENNSDIIISYNGLFSNLTKLIYADGMLWGGGLTAYADDLLFSPLNANGDLLNINALNETIPSTVVFITNASKAKTEIVSSDYAYARASKLLTFLPNITNISYEFSSTWIDFDSVTTSNGVNYCPLFYNNTKLTQIYNSFLGIKGKGSLLNIFGGNSEFDSYNKFPKKLTNLLHCFEISSAENGQLVYYPIHNEMFRQIKNTLKSITDTNNTNLTVLSSCFYGAGLNKVFKQEKDEIFPYDIFKNMPYLKEIPGFFANMDCKDKNGNKTTSIKLPGDMFTTNTNITNLSYAFYAMNNAEITLTSKGFINCSLINVSHIFDEGNIYNQSIVGYIPYGLFYQIKNIKKSFVGIKHADAIALGISDSNYGIDSTGKWLSGATDIANINYESETIPMINATINNISYALQYMCSTLVLPYNMNIGNNMDINNYGDILDINSDYQPIEYLANPNYSPSETIPNPNYDPNNPESTQTIPNPKRDIHRIISAKNYNPYKYVWNSWAIDGSSKTTNAAIKQSNLYQAVLNGTFTDVSTVINDRMDEHSDNSLSGTGKKYTNNFLCPPDLFRYCINSTNVNIDGTVSKSLISQFSGLNTEVYGLGGRIPQYIFEPINNMSKASGVFSDVINLSPYDWGNTLNSGKQYPSKLFAKCTNLLDVSYIFSNETILPSIIIPSDLFKDCPVLSNIQGMWSKCNWLDTTNSQIPSGLFNYNSNIKNVSYLFSSWDTTSEGTYGRSPKIISKDIFTVEKNPYISNISYFYLGANMTTGTVPEFWKWSRGFLSSDSISPFIGMSKAKISNSSSIPSTMSVGMVD